MNIKEFVDILKTPGNLQMAQVQELDNIVQEYPYFQAARVLQLKILHSQESYRYSKALKLAAVHVANRSVLFDFINEKTFQKPKEKPTQTVFNTDETMIKKPLPIVPKIEIPLQEQHKVPPKLYKRERYYDDNDSQTENRKNEERNPLVTLSENTLKISTTDNKLYSFSQWLKNITEKGEQSVQNQQIYAEQEERVSEKFKLIDRFLEENPKIEPSRDYVSNVNLANEVKTDPKQLMTETLAQIYSKQKKYKQAIQAYEILILKNPEKSGYFADQIKAIKNLQQNNS